MGRLRVPRRGEVFIEYIPFSSGISYSSYILGVVIKLIHKCHHTNGNTGRGDGWERAAPSSKWSTKRELARAGIIATKVGHRYTKGDPKSARYAHLVNDGHVAVYWGHRGGGRVKAIKYQNEAQRASIAPVKAAAVAKGRDAVIAAAKKARQKMLQVGK